MILDRYIFKTWLGPFLGGLFLVLCVLLLGRALKLLATVSDSGQVWSLIAELLILTMPYFLLLTVPMAFFLSMQNTITSLQQNSEMDALRASGVSYSRMLRVFLPVVLLLWLSLTYTATVLMPNGQINFYNVLAKVYAMKGVITFSPQRFTQGFDGVTVYVDGEDKQGVYHGVILEDHRSGISVIYTAKSARFIMGGSYLELRMDNGVRLEGAGADQRMLSFDHYQVSIPLSDGKWSKRKSGDHVTMMTMTELWEQMQSAKPAAATAELSRRILLPSTVLLLFFFALPLSITQKRSGKAGSLISGIALLVMIYNAQLLLHRQVSQGAFPGWTMWAAQIAMLMLAMFLWRRAEADRMPRLFAVAGEWIYFVHQWIMHRLAHRWSQQR